jgi:hypothetical protein
MTQDKLEALTLASVKKDILLNLDDDDELVASFASQAGCRILLA